MIDPDGLVNLDSLFDTTLFAKGYADPDSFIALVPQEEAKQKIAELIRRTLPIQPSFIFPVVRREKSDPKPIQADEHAYTLFGLEKNEDKYLQTFVFTRKTSASAKITPLELSYRIDWTDHPDLTQRGAPNPHTLPHIHFLSEEKGKGRSQKGPSPEEAERIERVFNQTIRLSIQAQMKYQQEITERQLWLAKDQHAIQSLIMTGALPNIPKEMYTHRFRPEGPVFKSFIPKTDIQGAHFITMLVQGRKENGFCPYQRTYFFRQALADQEDSKQRLTHTLEWTTHRRRDTLFPHVIEWKDGVAMREGDGKGCGRPAATTDFVLVTTPALPQGSSTACGDVTEKESS